jgi:adenosylcobinamide-GDP ribazoletransferase
VTLVTALLEHGEALAALVVAGAVSRAAVLPLPLWLPYARAEPGSGAALSHQPNGTRAALGVAIAAALSLAILGFDAAPALLLAALVIGAVGLLARRRLDGVTGDVLGATIELAELAALATFVALV